MTKKVSATPSVLWTCAHAVAIGVSVSALQAGEYPVFFGILIGTSAACIVFEWALFGCRREVAHWEDVAREAMDIAHEWSAFASEIAEAAAQSRGAEK